MTDWKPTMLTASAPSGEMMTWINPSAIEQLQREVDALKVKAAPTPVEDEVTPEMCAAASRTWDKQTSWSSAATWTAVYRAMRAAAAPEDEVTEAEREAGVQAVWKNFPGLTIFDARTVADAIISAMRAARVPAPTPVAPTSEPSAELVALRELRKAVLSFAATEDWQAWADSGNDYAPFLCNYTIAKIARLLAALDAAEEGR